MELFSAWFEEAGSGDDRLPEAMALATATPDGRPSVRFVLLKGFDRRGFTFFTNYESRKGSELDQNRLAAAVLFWSEPRRQVRIEGGVERLSPAESDAYFRTRDRLSQLGAIASPQSRVIENRALLDRRIEELQAATQGQEAVRPDHWGGYRIVPHVIEFWYARENRLHDRVRYRLNDDGGWIVERLAP